MPRPRGRWLLAAVAGSGVFLVVALIAASRNPESAPALRAAAAVVFLGFLIALAAAGWLVARAIRAEHERLSRVEEMLLLRAWPQAAQELLGLLSRPMLSHAARAQGLIYLSSVLARYHQFADAIEVHNHLLDQVQMQPALAVSLRIARAMALLREDRLLDADRAISELRRLTNGESAGAALVEMYRDIKTGHPAEAIAVFRAMEHQWGPQLGHRAADAFLLAAKGYAMTRDETEARACYERATLLAPPGELARRYPEAADLMGRFLPAPAPPEAA